MSLSDRSAVVDHLKSLKYKLYPYYLLRPRLWRENLRPIDRRVAVSPKWNYVYIRVPKAANSTTINTLQRNFPEFRADSGNAGELKEQYRNFGHLSAHQAWHLSSDLFVFTVVRNPYHRLLSAYLDKLQRRNGHIRRRHAETIAHFDGGVLTFRGFCRYLAEGGERRNAHWMRQTRILGVSDRIDYIGHMESLAWDLEQILLRINGGQEVILPERTGPTSKAAEKVRRYYDAECAQIVEQVYAQDFTELGYRLGEF